MVDWASLTLFITLSSSLAAACGVSSGGFTMALLEWLTLKEKTMKCAQTYINNDKEQMCSFENNVDL